MEQDENKENNEENNEETKANEDNKENLSIVDEAKKVRDEIKSENDRREQILKEEQNLKANEMLGGTAGGRVEPEVKEETPKEYADRILKGN